MDYSKSRSGRSFDGCKELIMDLAKYEKKHVRVRDIYGETFTGLASYGNYEFLMHEYGGEEDGIFIENYLIYNSQVDSIEEIEVHGTAELCTERLTLRRYIPEDADPLYKVLKKQKGFAGWDMEHPIAHILDDMLTKADPDYKTKSDIKWNFTKFLINKKGQVVARFEPTEKTEKIEQQIRELL